MTAADIMKKWFSEGKDWTATFYPYMAPFTIPAKGSIRIPSEDYIFKAKEGVLEVLSATFDHPKCAIGIKTESGFDLSDRYTVQNMAIGVSSTPLTEGLYAIIPPSSPPGIYTIRRDVDLFWTDWLTLSVLNPDNAPHTCFAYAYQIVLVNKI